MLIFGGGWGPEGTQASIEAHARALSDALRPLRPTLLFAAGASTVRAVQVKASTPDRTGDLLARVFDRPTDLAVAYRRTRLAPSGPASRAALLAFLERADPKAPLFLFGAGHGRAADPTTSRPASLELWGPDDRVTPTDLARAIDGRRATTALVLGHCHAGAFAAVSRAGASPDGALATPARCVFAAVPGDREAAGCTPDLAEASSAAYLAQVAIALGTPAGDLDKDGAVTLEEAHVYASLHDPTIDVPVRSSEIFLESSKHADRAPPETLDWKALEAGASPAERVRLRSFPGGERPARTDDARALIDRLDARIRSAGQDLERASAERESTRREVLDRVLSRWPELANPYHARSRQLLGQGVEKRVKWIERLPSYQKLLEREESTARLDEALLDLEIEAAKLERWWRAVAYVQTRRAYRASAKKKDRRRFDALLSCERSVVRASGATP